MMFGEHSFPSNCTGYQSRFFVRSNTGNIALRLAEVQPPNTVDTPSLSISFDAFCAKVDGSDAPSSTRALICLPSTPPVALISSIASISAFFTVISLIAIVPVSDWSTPTDTLSPAGALALSPPPEQEASASAQAEVASISSLERIMMCRSPPGRPVVALRHSGWDQGYGMRAIPRMRHLT